MECIYTLLQLIYRYRTTLPITSVFPQVLFLFFLQEWDTPNNAQGHFHYCWVDHVVPHWLYSVDHASLVVILVLVTSKASILTPALSHQNPVFPL